MVHQINSVNLTEETICIEGHPDNLNLTQEEQLTFPLLIGLLDTEKTMNL
jgi:hypothetical protein